MNKAETMSFKVGRLFAAAFVVALFIQMQIAESGYAASGAKIASCCHRETTTVQRQTPGHPLILSDCLRHHP